MNDALEPVPLDIPGEPEGVGTPALWLGGPDAVAQLVLAHGAGAGMEHPALDRLTRLLCAHRIATLRYEFPYMAAGRRRPDRARVLEQTVRRAVAWAAATHPDLPLFAGGRSMGGRMTTRAEADEPLVAVRGIVLFAFPLHPPKKPGTERAAHLERVRKPMLFLQGTRDELARLELMRPVVERLGEAARLHLVDGADHSFHVLVRSGRHDAEVEDEVAATAARWISERLF